MSGMVRAAVAGDIAEAKEAIEALTDLDDLISEP